MDPAPTAILVTSATAVARPQTVTRLLHGLVSRTTRDPRGTIHWVLPGEIVLYSVRGQQPRTFVFRTANAAANLLSSVPGVAPRVTLLVQTTTANRQALLQLYFRNLLRQGRNPTLLADRLYAKLNIVLSRRTASRDALDALLLQHDAPAV